MTPEEAVKHIESHQKIFMHTGAAIPQTLAKALANRKDELRGVEVYQLHTEGEAPYATEDCKEAFHIKAFFVGKSTRSAVQSERGSYIPIFLSEIPYLFKNGIIELDVALVSVSTPDKHGYCSLGPSVDITLEAIKQARIVIAQVNAHLPRTHGDGIIHIDDINYCIYKDEPLPNSIVAEPTETEIAIGNNIVDLIDDGATLQMGIGAIPNAVLASLHNHKNIGIHTEMFSDGILPLVEKGVINGKLKKEHPGIIIGSFAIGSNELYDFIDDNPLVQLMNSNYVNNTDVIRRNPNMIAVNSAIEIDLTGQVCADSIGNCIYSGVGGQMDFIRGASLSRGGKPIIALPSSTRTGESKIVPYLKQGAGVVTTRAHIHWVVSEFGAVNLYGKSIEDRMKLMISIAHPDHQEELDKVARGMRN